LAVEVFGYGWVSATALAIDASLLKVLVTLGGWNYLIASTVSFIVGAYVVYALSVRFVFRFRQIRNRAWEFGSFIALGIVGLLVNAFVLSLAISVMGWGLITAKLGAALCTFATNFILRRGLLFSPKGISK
jgi:putative flippase GtrA